jgi:hypothetical protein
MFIEVLVRRVTTPRLEKLDLHFFKYPTVYEHTTSASSSTAPSSSFFKDWVHMMFYPHRDAKLHAFSISVDWWYLDWRVSSVARSLNSPGEKLSAVEHLTLEHRNCYAVS